MKRFYEEVFYQSNWKSREDFKSYGPAARHTQRIILSLLNKLHFETVLDVGCGTATLLKKIHDKYIIKPQFLTGLEYSKTAIIGARKKLPQATFKEIDISQNYLPKKYDLVLCVDVLEHITKDLEAIQNLYKMTKKYLLVVVPVGPLFEVEKKKIGHVHGYSKREVTEKLRKAGFAIVKSFSWGFPFYNIYRRISNKLPREYVLGEYSNKKKFISNIIYLVLLLNILPFWGERFFVICERK